MDNYRISRDRAKAYFLQFPQQKLIDMWGLKHDENRLYVDFLGKPYAICRETGSVTRLWNGSEAEFGEVLSIFDLLCHEGCKTAAGRYAPVNSLKGGVKTAGVGTDFHHGTAAAFDRDADGFANACRALGGEPVDMGDVGFRFPLFDSLWVILKFYRSDEDFPASVTLLWDENMLEFAYYETVFYIAGVLLDQITEKMKEHTL